MSVQEIFHEVEKELVDLITEMGYQKGRNKKYSVISAFLYIRGDVTQKSLQQLTGYKRATVSNILIKLEEIKLVTKQYNKQDRQYHYFLNGTLSDVLGRSMVDINMYFLEIEKKLNEISIDMEDPSLSEKNGYKNIEEFVDKMKILIPAFQNLMAKFQRSGSNEQTGGK